MALIRPRVDGDAVGASVDTGAGMGDHIRVIALPGVANQRNFIDVDAEGNQLGLPRGGLCKSVSLISGKGRAKLQAHSE